MIERPRQDTDLTDVFAGYGSVEQDRGQAVS